ncbi:MAG: hypothetical protein CVU16_06700 [Betaproteobacteria bacterium HGW-Betaproteobacteria-10]|nr:MAG: hypothetical protein CVU16_06700 [Betaproteobacteria bacterium HGW-Betaproteobacteria-10]
MKQANQTTPLSLQAAAQSLASSELSTHDLEELLAHAIEHGELRANVMRWATEQWEGRQLPGNINRLETFIERGDLNAWLAARQ